ncbi:MAG: hypothetical protein JXM69_17185 [Anaerolineae bacterium]|nr:hypothetical protein [Anaerolineae bacterium]
MIFLILTACQSTSLTPTIIPPIETPTSAELDPSTLEATASPITDHTPTPSTSTPPSTPAPTARSHSSRNGGMASLGLIGQPNSLNPITENNTALREIAPLLFDTLLRVDPQTAQLQPGLAQQWEYTDDGQQVIFHLPSDLSWSNGNRFTAADIADSLTATQHPALLAFSDIGAQDEDTLIFTFLNIDCAAVTILAQLPLVPATEITASIPTGSGPFMLADWSKNKRTLSLAQNPNYHGPKPYLDNFGIRFLHEDEIAIALSEGQFDAIGPIQSSIHNSQSIIQHSPFTVYTYPAAQVVYIALNYDPLNDPPLPAEVRQALPLALDREAILNEILKGEGHLLAAPLLPGHWATNNNLSPPDYAPAEARRLLAQAGLKDTDGDGWLDQNGQRLELSIRLNGNNPLHQNLGWLVSGYYRDLGLFARAESVPFDSVVDDLFTHDFTLAIFSWPILSDPDQRLYWHSTENTVGIGLNFTSYHNPQLDALLGTGVAVPGCQPQERAPIYAEVQQILAQERPVDFLLAPHRHILRADRLQGLQPGPFAPFTWNATAWYLQP